MRDRVKRASHCAGVRVIASRSDIERSLFQNITAAGSAVCHRAARGSGNTAGGRCASTRAACACSLAATPAALTVCIPVAPAVPALAAPAAPVPPCAPTALWPEEHAAQTATKKLTTQHFRA
jgi:hypothetical protein